MGPTRNANPPRPPRALPSPTHAARPPSDPASATNAHGRRRDERRGRDDARTGETRRAARSSNAAKGGNGGRRERGPDVRPGHDRCTQHHRHGLLDQFPYHRTEIYSWDVVQRRTSSSRGPRARRTAYSHGHHRMPSPAFRRSPAPAPHRGDRQRLRQIRRRGTLSPGSRGRPIGTAIGVDGRSEPRIGVGSHRLEAMDATAPQLPPNPRHRPE